MARLANQMKQLYAMCATALVMGRADLDGADDVGFDIELPIFTVGQAAELGNIHPQTLRQYDRLGLVRPQRTDGGARRYCLRDIARLTRAQRLSQDEGINLSGIARILVLEEENRQSCFGRIAVRNCQCRKQPPVKHRQVIRQRSFCR